MADTKVVTDIDSVKDIMANAKGIMFDSLGESFETDSSQVSVFSDKEKEAGLQFFKNIFESVVDEVSGLSTYKPKKDVKNFVDQYNLTQNEVHFIKKVKPNKVFFLKKIPSIHFVKLSNGSFINAETYVFRLESGLINLNKKYEQQVNINKNQQEYVDRLEKTCFKYENYTTTQLFKLAINKLLGRNNA